jgi:hypothetical protein
VGVSRRRTILHLYELYNRAEFDATSLLPDDLVYHPLPQTLSPEPVVGGEALRKLLEPDLFKRQWVNVEEVVEHGDFVVVELRSGGETVGGATLEQHGFQLWRFEGELPCETWVFNSRADAEREAGLRD